MSEKKCENCVFCAPKPENMQFLPNDWVCGSISSKWRGYWSPTGCCERFREPTGKTVEEVIGERGKGAFEGLTMILNALWSGNSVNDYIDKFLKEDSAILEDYEKYVDVVDCKEDQDGNGTSK